MLYTFSLIQWYIFITRMEKYFLNNLLKRREEFYALDYRAYLEVTASCLLTILVGRVV